MFIIASSGRSGTYAICKGLNDYGDHTVMHEPEPRLLEEAFHKHKGLPYQTDSLRQRMQFFAERDNEKYGESFRAPNLLPEIIHAAAKTRVLILVRNPLDYVVSAHAKLVFRKKDDPWDRFRIIPDFPEDTFINFPLAEKIAWHWVAVNRYLLEFAESTPSNAKVAVLADLGAQIHGVAEYLGVVIKDPEGLNTFLASHPNASDHREFPDGYDRERILSICENEWKKAQQMATW
jgi:hypothetical protein